MTIESYRQVLEDGVNISIGPRTSELSIVPLQKHYHPAGANEFQVSCSHMRVSVKDKATGVFNPYIRNYTDLDAAIEDFLKIKESLYD